MKKIITLLITLLLCMSFAGCATQEKTDPAKADAKTVKEVTVYLSEDKLVIPDYELAEDEVAKFVTEDGVEVKVDGADDLADGSYELEVTQVVDGKDVTNTMVVVLGEDAAEPAPADTPADEPSASGKKEFNWNVEINGVMYTPENIHDSDVDTSIAYVKGVFGDNVKYSLETIGAGWDLFADIDGVVVDSGSFGNDCAAIVKLREIWKSGSHITVYSSPAVKDACGL